MGFDFAYPSPVACSKRTALKSVLDEIFFRELGQKLHSKHNLFNRERAWTLFRKNSNCGRRSKGRQYKKHKQLVGKYAVGH